MATRHLTAIAYFQPITRGELSQLFGKEVSRDVIRQLRALHTGSAGCQSAARRIGVIQTTLFASVKSPSRHDHAKKAELEGLKTSIVLKMPIPQLMVIRRARLRRGTRIEAHHPFEKLHFSSFLYPMADPVCQNFRKRTRTPNAPTK
jgi:hypothetical protein